MSERCAKGETEKITVRRLVRPLNFEVEVKIWNPFQHFQQSTGQTLSGTEGFYIGQYVSLKIASCVQNLLNSPNRVELFAIISQTNLFTRSQPSSTGCLCDFLLKSCNKVPTRVQIVTCLTSYAINNTPTGLYIVMRMRTLRS